MFDKRYYDLLELQVLMCSIVGREVSLTWTNVGFFLGELAEYLPPINLVTEYQIVNYT